MKAVEFISERKKKKAKRKKAKRTSLRRYFFPGYGYFGNSGDTSAGEGGGGGDGGGGGESILGKKKNEGYSAGASGGVGIDEDIDITDEVNKFKDYACKRLHIKNPPYIELSMDTEEAQTNHHTGGHIIGDNKIWVYAKNRNLVDILRTVFHELVHVRQGELDMVGNGDSYPGSPIEAMADMLAGKYIKIYGKANRHVFQ